MKPYHDAWLGAHSNRTQEWLADKLKDGFDIHHLDHNHDNNEPSNLVLIECTDHLALHGGGANRLRRAQNGPRGPSKRMLEKGKKAYEFRAYGHSWTEQERDFEHFFENRNYTSAPGIAYSARIYALKQGLAWPVPTK